MAASLWRSVRGDDQYAAARAAYTTTGFTALPTVFYSRLL